jgi:hypothetical protein
MPRHGTAPLPPPPPSLLLSWRNTRSILLRPIIFCIFGMCSPQRKSAATVRTVWLVFSIHLVNCCPHGRRTILVYSCPSTVPSHWPPPPLPLLKQNVQNIQTVCALGGGRGVLKCTVDHILQEFYTLFLAKCRTYKIEPPPQTKMTSKDDLKGLVSLKFLRPWVTV